MYQLPLVKLETLRNCHHKMLLGQTMVEQIRMSSTNIVASPNMKGQTTEEGH